MMTSWLILEFTESDQCVDLDKNSPRLVPSKTFSVDGPVYPDGGCNSKVFLRLHIYLSEIYLKIYN